MRIVSGSFPQGARIVGNRDFQLDKFLPEDADEDERTYHVQLTARVAHAGDSAAGMTSGTSAPNVNHIP
jgi:hypothetical protein